MVAYATNNNDAKNIFLPYCSDFENKQAHSYSVSKTKSFTEGIASLYSAIPDGRLQIEKAFCFAKFLFHLFRV
jgi:hypothetical protein